MAKTIMITGGTGYIGAWLTKMLLEKGYTVRLTVRDKNRTEKYAPLQEIATSVGSTLDLYEADLLKDGSFDEAARGADAIMHIASPFILRVKDPQKDLIEPAVNGTQNVLGAASRSGSVKKVVLTSSIAAIMGDNVEMAEKGLSEIDETQFNTSSRPDNQPYQYSKVTAEKEAWKLHDAQTDWKLVVINPSFVMGPTLENIPSDSESLQFMKGMISGNFATGAPDLKFGFVDVRDVARAHVLALENDDAAGRFLLAERATGVFDLAQLLRDEFGNKFKLPKSIAPKFLLYLTGWMFGVTISFVKRNVGHNLKLNTSRSRDILGLKYIDLKVTVRDMVNQMS